MRGDTPATIIGTPEVAAPTGAGSHEEVAIGSHGQVHERAPARAQSIAPLRRAVVEFAASCGATGRRCEDIAIAVSEALTNAVVHGYAGLDEPGDVAVQAWLDDRSLQVVICDEGVGMRPRFQSPGMGFGLALISRMTDQVRFEDVMPGLRLRMTFALG